MPMLDQREQVESVPWGLVLAAGDGRRMEGYIREVTGKLLPKQYVNFTGKHSMLEHTFRRTEKLIPAERILTIVGRHHLDHSEVQRQLSSRPAHTIIVQPDNKDTCPGILLPLMHLHKHTPDAIVAVFPSDHFILEEDRFMEAQYPEVEYGYLVPREEHGPRNPWGLRSAARFVEKPDVATAQQLVDGGGLWNTMTMVFHVGTVLKLLRRFCSATYRRFGRIYDAIGTPDEAKTTQEVYRNLKPVNFSKGFLEIVAASKPERIAILPVLHVFWSDWGSARRLLQVREELADSMKKHQHAQAQTLGAGEVGTKIREAFLPKQSSLLSGKLNRI